MEHARSNHDMATNARIRRVFLSSPLQGQEEYREAAKKAIGKFQNIHEDFTEWTAETGSPLEVSLRRVQSSDLFVLILAYRYGAEVDELNGKSITHAEVEAAISAEIPIRAFFVDKDYPWVPKDIDADLKKLEALKEQVKKTTTPAYFRSPESLEIELARCFLEILIAEGLRPEAEIARLVRPGSLADLSASAQGHFVMGEAPDGLPLGLGVTQDESALTKLQKEISELLAACQIKKPDELTNTIIQGATTVAKAKARQLWEARPTTPTGDLGKSFVIQHTIPLLSVFNGILDSCLKKIETTRSGVLEAFTTMVVSEEFRDRSESSKKPVILGHSIERARLGLGVNDTGEKYILAWHHGKWQLRRQFITESFCAIKKVRYGIRLDPRKITKNQVFLHAETLTKQGAGIYVYGSEMSLEDFKQKYHSLSENLLKDEGGVHLVFHEVQAYHRALKNTDLRLDSSSIRVYATFPESSLVEVVKEAAVALTRNPSIIHGNLKPSNILITDAGVQVVDGWDVIEGNPTPFFSDAWAPPEQAMGEGLSASADVYSLCKVLSELLRLQVSGELVTFRVPKWDSPGEHMFQFISKPYIQYRHNKSISTFSDRHKLRDLLGNGLAGRREERIASVQVLLERLCEINFNELTELRRITIHPGFHTHQLRFENGKYSAFRWIQEPVRLDPMIGKESHHRRYDRDRDMTMTQTNIMARRDSFDYPLLADDEY